MKPLRSSSAQSGGAGSRPAGVRRGVLLRRRFRRPTLLRILAVRGIHLLLHSRFRLLGLFDLFGSRSRRGRTGRAHIGEPTAREQHQGCRKKECVCVSHGVSRVESDARQSTCSNAERNNGLRAP